MVVVALPIIVMEIALILPVSGNVVTPAVPILAMAHATTIASEVVETTVTTLVVQECRNQIVLLRAMAVVIFHVVGPAGRVAIKVKVPG